MDLKKLTAVFPPDVMEWRPGATTKDKKKAIALGYVDMRVYEERADQLLGPDGWSVEVIPINIEDRAAFIACLTVGKIKRYQVGEELYRYEGGKQNANSVTTAYAQAVKRAWASLGLGRYLYSLPVWWEEYDGRAFTNAATQRLAKKYEAWLKGEPPPKQTSQKKQSPLELTEQRLGDNLKSFGRIEAALGKALGEMSQRELGLVYGYAIADCTQEAENVLVYAFSEASDWKDAQRLYKEKYGEE